jgi:arylsulfatase A-like enzyme
MASFRPAVKKHCIAEPFKAAGYATAYIGKLP